MTARLTRILQKAILSVSVIITQQKELTSGVLLEIVNIKPKVDMMNEPKGQRRKVELTSVGDRLGYIPHYVAN